MAVKLRSKMSHWPEIPRRYDSAQGSDLAPFFGDLSQNENLSEIKLSLLGPKLQTTKSPAEMKGKEMTSTFPSLYLWTELGV